MLKIIKSDTASIVIKDEAVAGRVFALLFTGAGTLLAYFSWPQLPDGNGFLVGILLAIVGLLIFLTKKSHLITVDKNSNKLFYTSISLFGREKIKEYSLSILEEINLQWVSDMHAGTAWLLYAVVADAEDTIALNVNSAPWFRWLPGFRRSKDIGEKIARFLAIPFKQKKFFED